MSNAAVQPHGVMEGEGSYNKHAKLPAGGAALAMPLLEKAVQSLELDRGEQPIVIADYGSSQGKNSIVPMQVAIRGLRRRVGPNRAISVFHIDQPSNDFTTLFAVLDSDPDRYVLDEPYVFPAESAGTDALLRAGNCTRQETREGLTHLVRQAKSRTDKAGPWQAAFARCPRCTRCTA